MKIPGLQARTPLLGLARAVSAGAFVALVASAVPTQAAAQLRTMNDDCRQGIDAADQLNAADDHAAALTAFDALVDGCGTRDAREQIQAGRAHALNGLERYDDAIQAAESALDAYDESLFGLFERAYAREQLGAADSAAADYRRIIELTEMNENVAERATIYAKVADLNYQAGKVAEAEEYLANATALDPGNPAYAIMRGDWAARAGDTDAAFAAYDQALEMSGSGEERAEVYEIRAQARLTMVQEKYGTTNAQELRRQMTPTETEQVCSELTRALEAGMQDMQLDMFSALVCR
ncbi:MAG: hypothetical protein P8177_13630 [Gemmatimonadota bacterium]|jgi:tetratricopeptide (TPR) repeat protein